MTNDISKRYFKKTAKDSHQRHFNFCFQENDENRQTSDKDHLQQKENLDQNLMLILINQSINHTIDQASNQSIN